MIMESIKLAIAQSSIDVSYQVIQLIVEFIHSKYYYALYRKWGDQYTKTSYNSWSQLETMTKYVERICNNNMNMLNLYVTVPINNIEYYWDSLWKFSDTFMHEFYLCGCNRIPDKIKLGICHDETRPCPRIVYYCPKCRRKNGIIIYQIYNDIDALYYCVIYLTNGQMALTFKIY